jgi:hypothetical protein
MWRGGFHKSVGGVGLNVGVDDDGGEMPLMWQHQLAAELWW